MHLYILDILSVLTSYSVLISHGYFMYYFVHLYILDILSVLTSYSVLISHGYFCTNFNNRYEEIKFIHKYLKEIFPWRWWGYHPYRI